MPSQFTDLINKASPHNRCLIPKSPNTSPKLTEIDPDDLPDKEAFSRTKALSLNDPLVTPDNTSKLLGVTPGTLQVWRSTGRYTLRYVKVGGKVMYRMSFINQFIDEQTKLHTGE